MPYKGVAELIMIKQLIPGKIDINRANRSSILKSKGVALSQGRATIFKKKWGKEMERMSKYSIGLKIKIASRIPRRSFLKFLLQSSKIGGGQS